MEATHLGLLLLQGGDRLREFHLGREKLRERICELEKETTVARDGVTKEAVGVAFYRPGKRELCHRLPARHEWRCYGRTTGKQAK